MLNPAWRPAQIDNPTLAQIKHNYFQPNEQLMDSSVQEVNIPVIRACVSGNTDDCQYLTNALERQLNLPGSFHSHLHENWKLNIIDVAAQGTNYESSLILLIVEAKLDALKDAYAQLKEFKHLRDVSFSVIIQGARDSEMARRYYRRLAMGSMRFLDMPLLFCGTAPERGEDFSQGIADLSERVKRSSELYASLNHSGEH